MAGIIHRIGIKAPIADIYKCLSTTEGLAGWWTEDTKGESKVGNTLYFTFANKMGEVIGRMGMKVAALDNNKKVQWTCVEGPADWIGTELTFDLKQEGDQVILLFSHSQWKEATESTAHCSMKWAIFLLSLKDLVVNGKGKPSPNDIKIDNWN